jgi:hypothetical protein
MTREVDAGGVLLDVVAAIDYLASTHRLGLTVCEAVEEALRWWTADRLALPGELPDDDFADLPWGDDPDPLRTAVARVLASTSGPDGPDGLALGVIIATALDGWVRRMADLYNDGHRFAHPAPRHGWPSPLYDASSDAGQDEWR